jgi:uncharacterized protein YbjT (DUF2867 family)
LEKFHSLQYYRVGTNFEDGYPVGNHIQEEACIMEINVILFGATGMVGSGVLIECLANPAVKSVLVIGRNSCQVDHPKLKESIISNFEDYSDIKDQLSGYDACFYCLGITSLRTSETDYTKITYHYTLAAARTLVELNPQMTFAYISGAGTRQDGKGAMWIRVKGRVERDLSDLPFKQVYLLRPAYIQPTAGVKHVHIMYKLVGWLYPLWKRIMPNLVITCSELGRAMINTVLNPQQKQVLESRDLRDLGRSN